MGSTAVTPHHREVLELLKTGDFDLLHFTGHGRASTGDIADAHVLLAGRLNEDHYVEEPLHVSVVRQNFAVGAPGPIGSVDSPDRYSVGGGEAPDYSNCRPMVVVNACQIGRSGHQLSTIDGFAEAFVLGGAAVFVGCMWSVGDQPAREFVEEFYRCLLAGSTVAEASAVGRASARGAGDATWLAYSVYAHPHARLSWT